MTHVNGSGEISDLQKKILVNLLKASDKPGPHLWQYRKHGEGPWRTRVYWQYAMPISTSRSASASIARALRRLEERGFVERVNSAAGSTAKKIRTTHVELTDAGRTLAEQLPG
jgi:acetolactate synthase regulatory subunit